VCVCRERGEAIKRISAGTRVREKERERERERRETTREAAQTSFAVSKSRSIYKSLIIQYAKPRLNINLYTAILHSYLRTDYFSLT
jgi:hypothetical protein